VNKKLWNLWSKLSHIKLIYYSQEIIHVQLGPIKLKPIMSTVLKAKWQAIWNGFPTRHE
jgi:hypothetical protein